MVVQSTPQVVFDSSSILPSFSSHDQTSQEIFHLIYFIHLIFTQLSSNLFASLTLNLFASLTSNLFASLVSASALAT